MLSKIKKDYLVKDVMLHISNCPVVMKDTILKEAIETMGISRLGIISVVNSENHLLGIITDGDLRRKLLKVQKPLSFFLIDDVIDHCIKKPLVTLAANKLIDAIKIMEDNGISDLPVVDKYNKLEGMLHLHKAINKLM